MPQAIQPGGYSNMFRQQLLQTLLLQTAQMLGGGGIGGLQQPVRNPALMATIDTALNSTVVSIDTQLAGVGIGVTSGLTPAPAPPGVVNRGAAGGLTPQGQVVPNTLGLTVNPTPTAVPAPAAARPVLPPNVIQPQRLIGLA